MKSRTAFHVEREYKFFEVVMLSVVLWWSSRWHEHNEVFGVIWCGFALCRSVWFLGECVVGCEGHYPFIAPKDLRSSLQK